MKTAPDCLACFLRQSLRVARLNGCSRELEIAVLRGVAELLPECEFQSSPPTNAIRVYETIAEITGCSDPYLRVKQLENERALQVLPALRKEVSTAPQPFLAAVGFAIAANIIDYGASERFDVADTFLKCREMQFAIDHRQQLLAAVNRLQPGSSILYLADNCGEIVYDSLVVELLAQRGLEVTVVVRDRPIINDALVEDAEKAGIGSFARIMTNGTACPGTPLSLCSEDFRHRFDEADLVISKGQGNFETLSEADREIYFLLTVKCKVVAEHLCDLIGDGQSLSGKGALAVYHTLCMHSLDRHLPVE